MTFNYSMRSKTIQTIILFILIGLIALLFILWLTDFSSLHLPEVIPFLQLNTYGLLVLGCFVLIFIFLQKRLLKLDPKTSILNLIIASTIVSLISIFLYEAIRQLIILRGQYSYDLFSVLRSSLIPGVFFILVAASISLELRKVKRAWKYVPMMLLLIFLLLIKQHLHEFEW